MIPIPLQALANAMAARAALARSLSNDFTYGDCAAFAGVDAQVNAQLEASVVYLAAHESVPAVA